MFLILSGVSGSGKQTIINQLLQEYENSQFLKSVTTRPPRAESNHQYLHLTEEEFEEKRKHLRERRRQNVYEKTKAYKIGNR